MLRRRDRGAGGEPAFQGIGEVVQRAVAVGEEGVALLVVAGDHGWEAADAEFLRGEEIAEGFVVRFGRVEGGDEFRPIEAGFLGNVEDLVGARSCRGSRHRRRG